MKIRVFNMKWPKGMPDWTHPARKEQTYVELPDSLSRADKGDAEYQDELIHNHILEALKSQFAGNVPLDFDWDEDIKDPKTYSSQKKPGIIAKPIWQQQLQAIENKNTWRDYI